VTTTLTASGLPPTNLVESVKNLVYVCNRLPDAGGVSPFEKLFGRVPSMSKLSPFGCLSFMLLDESKRKKLDIKSQKGILLVNLDHGNYRLLDLSTRKVHVSRHVFFIEDKLPARAFSGQSEHGMDIPTSSSKVGTSTGKIPYQARESDGDDIPNLMDDPESDYSVSEDDSERRDIPELEEDHECADDSEREEVIDSESSDAIPEIDIGSEVRGGDGLQFSSEYPSFPPRSSSRTRRSPKEWRAFQAETLKFHSTQEPDVRIPITGQNCHIRDTYESDSPSLKSSLASPSRDLWEIAIA
jgi:hypothetical protein